MNQSAVPKSVLPTTDSLPAHPLTPHPGPAQSLPLPCLVCHLMSVTEWASDAPGPVCFGCAVPSPSVTSDSATPWTVAHQTPLTMEILQARTVDWVAMPSSRGPSQPRDRTQISRIASGFFTICASKEAQISRLLNHSLTLGSSAFWGYACTELAAHHAAQQPPPLNSYAEDLTQHLRT